MRRLLSNRETGLLAACAGLLALALFGPALVQPATYHGFADQRVLWGLPYAMDVLSNLPFALAGLAGIWALAAAPRRSIANVQRAMAALFFGGLLLTAAASSWYHLQPDDAGLAIDRYGMAFAFAGLLGLAAAGRVSQRAGAVLGLGVLLLAPLAVHSWSVTGNLLPWAVVQAGGMLLVLACVVVPARPAALDIRWAGVIAAYGIAKLLEMNDHEVYRLTGEWVSGHTLKHVIAAFAAWPVIAAIRASQFSTQNIGGYINYKTAHERPTGRTGLNRDGGVTS